MSKERDRVRTRHWWKREDYTAIQDKAANCGLNISEYLRRCALGRKTTSLVDKNAVATLMKLGGLQLKLSGEIVDAIKDNRNEAIDRFAADHKKLYREIHKAIMAIKGKESDVDDSGISEK